jgi:pyridoxal/pyridoxine/pyridoxamine kinase
MATFVLQSLGCDVAALNTVHFSKPTQQQKREAEILRHLSPGISHYSVDTMMICGQAITPGMVK